MQIELAVHERLYLAEFVLTQGATTVLLRMTKDIREKVLADLDGKQATEVKPTKIEFSSAEITWLHERYKAFDRHPARAADTVLLLESKLDDAIQHLKESEAEERTPRTNGRKPKAEARVAHETP